MMRIDKYIDIHCHILPELDDGARNLADSIKLAQQAVKDNVGYISATPHHLDQDYINPAKDVLRAVKLFQQELILNNIDLKIFPSQEVHVNENLLRHLDDVLSIDAEGRYLLIELPHNQVPKYTMKIIFQLRCKGITPIIAHPERNSQILRHPDILFDLVNQGAIGQATASSLVGVFGKKVQRTAKRFVECGLLRVVASDAHALPKRYFTMTDAYKCLENMDVKYPSIFNNVAKNLVNGDEIKDIPIVHPVKRTFYLF